MRLSANSSNIKISAGSFSRRPNFELQQQLWILLLRIPLSSLTSSQTTKDVIINTQRPQRGPLQARLPEVNTPILHLTRALILFYSYDSEDGAVLRNIDACRAISQTVQTSLGPYGRNKIVINHLQKLILTSDAATILRELDVVHPAAKLLVMASQQQEAEMGDGTNMVIVLAGEMLKKAEDLLRMGLKTSDVVQGYEKAQAFALECLEGMTIWEYFP